MPLVPSFLVALSLLVLVLGTWAWQLTSSRSVIFNVVFCSAFMLAGAYATRLPQQEAFAFLLPFFATMLLGGRAIGFMWRSRAEPNLRAPGLLLSGCAASCAAGAAGAATAYFL